MIEQQASKPEREHWLGDIMEYGQNLALAVALVTFAGYAYYTEPVTDWPASFETLATICMLGAVIWALFAAIRFSDGITAHTRVRQGSAADYSITVAALLFSFFACGIGLNLPDNNHAVEMCERFQDKPDDEIHRSEPCRRLYDYRQAYAEEYRGR